MRAWAEFVLRHRRWVMVFWLIVMVAGGATSGKTSDRLTIDFSLPGQPGTEAARPDRQGVPQRRQHGAAAGDGHAAGGPDGHRQRGRDRRRRSTRSPRRRPETRCGWSTRPTPATRRSAPTTTARRTRMVFYPFPQSFDAAAARPRPIRDGRRGGRAGRRGRSGVTGIDALAVGDESGRPGRAGRDPARSARRAGSCWPSCSRRCWRSCRSLIAAVSILATFLMLLPLTYLTDVSFIVQFLVALVGLGVAIDYSLLFVTRWREERDHGTDNHEAVVAAMETAGHAVLFSGITVAIGLLALVVLPVPFMRSIGMRRCADPVRQRPGDAVADAGDPRRHRAAGRLAEDPPRERRRAAAGAAGRAWSCGAAGSPPVRAFAGARRCSSSRSSASRSAPPLGRRWPRTGRRTTRCRRSRTAA